MAGQAGQQVLELRQFDLQRALARARVLGEDVEDDGSAVEHADIERRLQMALLRGGQFVVGDDGVGVEGGNLIAYLYQLAFAKVGCRHGFTQPLVEAADDISAGGGGELSEFVQRVLYRPGRVGLVLIDADEQGAFGGGRGRDRLMAVR